MSSLIVWNAFSIPYSLTHSLTLFLSLSYLMTMRRYFNSTTGEKEKTAEAAASASDQFNHGTAHISFSSIFTPFYIFFWVNAHKYIYSVMYE